MKTYSIPLVPGPVSIPEEIRAVYEEDFGSSDMESEFFELYAECERGLREILGTSNQIAILSGEGMLALWAALKSAVRPGDRVLSIATGVFGHGIGEMARQVGAQVEVVDFGYDSVADPQQVREAVREFQPALVTAVHCETPSGTLNCIAEIGEICREANVLYYVDYVASAGGAPVRVDDWSIDLGLLGSQKVLSLMPDLAMVSISERAWVRIEEAGHYGYDALQPWRTAIVDQYMPYTHNWQAMAGLRVAIKRLLDEGLVNSYSRHHDSAVLCRTRLKQMGIDLWPAQEEYCAPTVTAAKVPAGWSWRELDRALRQHGMVVGGSYGPMAEKVFRIGHMGSQADSALVETGMDILETIMRAGPRV